MKEAKIRINEKDLSILSNTDFFIQKKRLTETVSELFAELRDGLRDETAKLKIDFPVGSDLATGKLSKGENYRELPYIILDFPKCYSKETIFSFRSMLWWGNHFSFHLHMSGQAWRANQSKFIERLSQLSGHDFYVCVHESPWEYHFAEDNFVPLETIHDFESVLRKKSFLKISRKLPLDQWQNIVPYGTETLRRSLELLS